MIAGQKKRCIKTAFFFISVIIIDIKTSLPGFLLAVATFHLERKNIIATIEKNIIGDRLYKRNVTVRLDQC